MAALTVDRLLHRASGKYADVQSAPTATSKGSKKCRRATKHCLTSAARVPHVTDAQMFTVATMLGLKTKTSR